MNYDFKHLQFLTNRLMRGDNLTNEDYSFIEGMRVNLRVANEQIRLIDARMLEC